MLSEGSAMETKTKTAAPKRSRKKFDPDRMRDTLRTRRAKLKNPIEKIDGVITLWIGKHPVLIDPEHLERVEPYRWHLRRTRNERMVPACYVGLDEDRRQMTTTLGRMLYNPDDGYVLLFKNKNKLDYRQENIRIVPLRVAQIQQGPRRSNETHFKGVLYRPQTGTYACRVWDPELGRHRHFGRYPTPEEAAKVYNEKAPAIQGAEGYLNKITDWSKGESLGEA